METILQHKKFDNTNVKKQDDSDKLAVNEIMSKYFVWFMNNNIEEFQKCCWFWAQRFTDQSQLFNTGHSRP